MSINFVTEKCRRGQAKSCSTSVSEWARLRKGRFGLSTQTLSGIKNLLPKRNKVLWIDARFLKFIFNFLNIRTEFIDFVVGLGTRSAVSYERTVRFDLQIICIALLRL